MPGMTALERSGTGHDDDVCKEQAFSSAFGAAGFSSAALYPC